MPTVLPLSSFFLSRINANISSPKCVNTPLTFFKSTQKQVKSVHHYIVINFICLISAAPGLLLKMFTCQNRVDKYNIDTLIRHSRLIFTHVTYNDIVLFTLYIWLFVIVFIFVVLVTTELNLKRFDQGWGRKHYIKTNNFFCTDYAFYRYNAVHLCVYNFGLHLRHIDAKWCIKSCESIYCKAIYHFMHILLKCLF